MSKLMLIIKERPTVEEYRQRAILLGLITGILDPIDLDNILDVIEDISNDNLLQSHFQNPYKPPVDKPGIKELYSSNKSPVGQLFLQKRQRPNQRRCLPLPSRT